MFPSDIVGNQLVRGDIVVVSLTFGRLSVAQIDDVHDNDLDEAPYDSELVLWSHKSEGFTASRFVVPHKRMVKLTHMGDEELDSSIPFKYQLAILAPLEMRRHPPSGFDFLGNSLAVGSLVFQSISSARQDSLMRVSSFDKSIKLDPIDFTINDGFVPSYETGKGVYRTARLDG